MTMNFTEFKLSMETELTNFIERQANGLSNVDLERLIRDFPGLRQRLATIPPETHPDLAEKIEFLCEFVREQVDRKGQAADRSVLAAAFALLYFQRGTDLIPDGIPNVGLVDDALIVDMVLRREENALKRSGHAHRMQWAEAKFDVDQLLSVISPVRISSFCVSG
jgi:uncharacterized membrane protein YkvA (DUF1232 family)